MEGHAVWGNTRNFDSKLGQHYLAMAEESSAQINTNKSQDNSGVTVGKKKGKCSSGKIRGKDFLERERERIASA